MKQTTKAAMPHMFTIKALDKLPGLFKPRRYLYHCARCKWSFVVNDGRRGALRPIAEDGSKLTRDEVVARASTFAAGHVLRCGWWQRRTCTGNGSNGRVHASSEEVSHAELPAH